MTVNDITELENDALKLPDMMPTETAGLLLLALRVDFRRALNEVLSIPDGAGLAWLAAAAAVSLAHSLENRRERGVNIVIAE